VACPKKSKAGPEGTEAAVNTLEGSLDKIEDLNSEANTEATEAAVERQELHKRLTGDSTEDGEDS
jgi:hypothetical protein